MNIQDRIISGKPIKREKNPNVFLSEFFNFIKSICRKYLPENFHFSEYGTDGSFISMGLCSLYQRANGLVVDKSEIKISQLQYLKNKENLSYQCNNALFDENKTDLSIYSFMMDSVTKQANMVEIVEMVKSQTRQYSIIALPDNNIYDNEMFLTELQQHFDVIERKRLRDSFIGTRDVVLLKTKQE
jgi:hypothetical protein